MTGDCACTKDGKQINTSAINSFFMLASLMKKVAGAITPRRSWRKLLDAIPLLVRQMVDILVALRDGR